MKKISLIGCTGNIGRQVVEVVRRYGDRFSFSALVCGSKAEELHALQEEFHPRLALCSPGDTEVFDDCDIAFIAAGGFAGLRYTLAAIRAGKQVALANKESLVCGGELVMAEARKRGVEIVPVDSEHSALFQALSFRRDTPFEKLILTASGGPFLRFSEEELRHVKAADALRHPTWNMGPKITIDSATMLNKGYEMIEAKWLYGASFDRIEAVIHPESIVHSAVCFRDGAVMAQMAYPDMRLPIQLALTYPERLPCSPALDLSRLGTLHFEPLPVQKFPCYQLALEAGKAGGTAPAVLNGAAEVAVQAFLSGGISFLGIAETIQDVLNKIAAGEASSYEEIFRADRLAREEAGRLIYGK